MSFTHGAQDGLKFLGIMNIYTNIVSRGSFFENEFQVLWICALTMGLGVLIGGKRIVTTVGEKIIKLENNEALCTDITTILTLLIASLLGMPVSTTHVKTMAIAGVSSKKEMINKNKFKGIVLAWGLTFPICGIVTFIVMKVLIQ